jgi:predicted nuclease of predicted toxin-antitoxin system
MDIVADESVDYAIIQALREIGFTVYAILEKSPGITDSEVLALANKLSCLLLTEDKDFGELTHKLNKKHIGS